jgi:hypothetical protein
MYDSYFPLILFIPSLVLGSKLDLDIHSNSCRLAFEGKLVHHYEDKSYRTKDLPQLKIYKFKEKKGVVMIIVSSPNLDPLDWFSFFYKVFIYFTKVHKTKGRTLFFVYV